MRSEKIQLVNEIGSLLKNSEFIFFLSYKGLTVKEFSEFRNQLAAENNNCAVECKVLKNKLIKKAAELNGFSAITDMELTGDTVVIAGTGDAVTTAKIIEKFAKKNQFVRAKSGYYDNQLLTQDDIQRLAALPSKEILQAQLIGLIQAPARNLVSVLYMKVSSIVNVLSAYKDKKDKGE